MGTEYAPFPKGKFNHLSKDITRVVDYYVEAAEKTKALEDATKAFDAAIDVYGNSNGAMFDKLLVRLKGLSVPADPMTDKQKQATVSQALDHLRHAIKLSSDPGRSAKEIREAVLMVLPLFCTFDSEGLVKMLNTAPDPTTPALLAGTDALIAEKNRCSGVKGHATKMHRKAVDAFEGVFSDKTLLDNIEVSKRGVEAYRIVKEFVDTWRYRARQFAVPVTVECSLISSLPQASRTMWMGAYTALDFTSLVKTDRYIPIRYKESALV